MKPSVLQTGDTIGIIAPSSVPRDMQKFRDGIATLMERGYRVEIGRVQYTRRGYLCGSDRERIDELNGFLRRPDVKLVIAARGGYGMMRLLEAVDYKAAQDNPTLIVGYSDITALHLAMYRKTGIPGLSGPMVAVEWHDPDPVSERYFWDLVRGGTPDPVLGPNGEGLAPVRQGAAEGTLLGGNLAMVVRLLGTPFLPDLEGSILFLEDVGEEPYRIDAMLAQLKLAGVLDRLGGLVLGGFTEWEPDDDSPTLTIEEVFEDYVSGLKCPVARGLVYGHFPVKNSLPVGVRARLSVTSNDARLGILEPLVA